jgi:hypothetical protein
MNSAKSSSTEAGQVSNVRMRASDADRMATTLILQDAIARGLLTPTEGGDRMSAALATVYLQDLDPLTADLPRVAVPTEPAGWRPLLLMAVEQLRSSLNRAITGRPSPAQLGAALFLVLLLVTCGLAVAHLALDNAGSAPHDGFRHR